MKLTMGRIVLLLAGVMLALLAVSQGVESLLARGGVMEGLAGFYLARGVAIAVVMSLTTAWLLVRYRRGYEDRLRACWEESQRIRLLFENIVGDAGEAILSLDVNGVIRTWNRAAERIYGYRAEEIVGRSFEVLVPLDLLAQGEPRSIEEVVEREGVARDVETRRLRKDGATIRVRITRSALRDGQGRVVGSSAIVRDITEEKRLEERLIAAEKMAAVGQAAASMAHEVRNALAGISGTIEVLRGSPLWRDIPPEVGTEVMEQIDRIAQSVDDLLSYARPGRLHLRRTDVHRILDRALAAGRACQTRDGRIVRDLADGPLEADVDAPRLEQAFQNVVANALHAMPERGTLTVASRLRGDDLVVTFTDTGPGMSPDVLSHAFEPFYTTKARGTGLGLPIVRNIVEAHGGRVDLASAAGNGTEVTITLPRRSGIRPMEAPAAGAPEPRVSPAALSRRPGGADVRSG